MSERPEDVFPGMNKLEGRDAVEFLFGVINDRTRKLECAERERDEALAGSLVCTECEARFGTHLEECAKHDAKTCVACLQADVEKMSSWYEGAVQTEGRIAVVAAASQAEARELRKALTSLYEKVMALPTPECMHIISKALDGNAPCSTDALEALLRKVLARRAGAAYEPNLTDEAIVHEALKDQK